MTVHGSGRQVPLAHPYGQGVSTGVYEQMPDAQTPELEKVRWLDPAHVGPGGVVQSAAAGVSSTAVSQSSSTPLHRSDSGSRPLTKIQNPLAQRSSVEPQAFVPDLSPTPSSATPSQSSSRPLQRSSAPG